MENEKYFYPIPESKKQVLKEYSTEFYIHPHPKAEKAEKTYDSQELVGMLNNWWRKICAENNVNPYNNKFKNISYYLMELGKNALEYTHGGEIKVIFEPNKITVAVSDQGQGFEDLEDVEYCSSSQYGHGLHQVRKYADEFCVESGGKKYAKIKGKRKLIDMGKSDTKEGSKITFIKNFENTSPNTE